MSILLNAQVKGMEDLLSEDLMPLWKSLTSYVIKRESQTRIKGLKEAVEIASKTFTACSKNPTSMPCNKIVAKAIEARIKELEGE